MRVTEKGQVTIPKAIRDKLGIVPGSEVDFVEGALGHVEIIRIDGSADSDPSVERLKKWIERVRGTGDPSVTTDDVMLATRGRRIGDPD
ncbi:AbrB/MazE/SpoVT family DNA-binding domain-containing protein [Oricola sp.]|uniref:AbrB/MazE/SpoVT family DNA-binding domain-containing protein n=1 Tax=Oricola sp. TaxID=1979950 RepID=UPI0025F0B662|nr:AbrB/MazE/SpoVT family DNA-binding domain-containing protein [Oricola sp.]MCI5074614.1 AbrB/MazE/SpoVT family DNA-binding domain-containing protein [Oricola sp.]